MYIYVYMCIYVYMYNVYMYICIYVYSFICVYGVPGYVVNMIIRRSRHPSIQHSMKYV